MGTSARVLKLGQYGLVFMGIQVLGIMFFSSGLILILMSRFQPLDLLLGLAMSALGGSIIYQCLRTFRPPP